MISGGTKHWVGVTLHRSTKAALTALRAEGWRLVAAHVGEKTRDYRDVDYTAKVAIMVGAELVGLSDAAVAAADDHIAIPMHGLGTSLNVSVAVGVILAEAERQRLAAGFYAQLAPHARGARAHAVRVVVSRHRGALPAARPPLPPAQGRRHAGVESLDRRVATVSPQE